MKICAQNGRANGWRSYRSFAKSILVAALFAGLASGSAFAHSPVVDSDLTDWCLGTTSNSFPAGGRTEDSSTTLLCGNCSVTTLQSCVVDSDCPVGEGGINPGSREEIVWWDNRTDGAVNDLATVAMTLCRLLVQLHLPK